MQRVGTADGNYQGNVEPTILGAFNELPEELILRIFSEMGDRRDLLSLSATCQSFCLIARDNSLWKRLFGADFPLTASKTDPSATPSYVDAYKKACIQSENLKTGWHQLHHLYAHAKRVTCVEGNETFLCSGSTDGALKIWDINTNALVKTLDGCPSEVVRVQFVGNRLYTAFAEGKIKVWDTTEWKCVNTIEIANPCTCIQVVDDLLYIGVLSQSHNFEIQIYDLKEDKPMRAIQHHLPLLWQPQFQVLNNWIFAQTPNDNCILLLKTSGELQHAFADPQVRSNISCFQLSNNILYTGAEDSTIALWDAKNGELIKVLKGHNSGIKSLKAEDNYLISGSDDGTVKVWDISTHECLHTFDGYVDSDIISTHLKSYLFTAIETLHFTNGCIYGGSGDGKVRVWDFNALPKSSYSLRQLESDLTLLEKMARLVRQENYDQLLTLITQAEKELHPDFQKRFEAYSQILVGSEMPQEKICGTVILQIQAEVCVELLLYAITSQNQNGIRELIAQLREIDPSYEERLYRLLWIELGTPDDIQQLSDNGFYQFDASIEQKVQAIIKFRQELQQKIS